MNQEISAFSFVESISKSAERLSFIYEECIFPNIFQIFSTGVWMLTGTLGFNYLSRKASNPSIFHLLSVIFGLFVIRYAVFDLELTLYFFGITTYCYGIICFAWVLKYYKLSTAALSYVIMTVASASMILGEIYFPNLEVWFRVRGLAMIACMKVISFGFCLERGGFLSLSIAFYGYIFFPGNVLFGPWISFQQYANLYRGFRKITLLWAIKIILLFSSSMCLLWLANCILPVLKYDPYYERWPKAYMDALLFRISHYFVMTLSAMCFLSSGIMNQDDQKDVCLTSLHTNITKPSLIEFPRSILGIVVNWNISMHKFLKKHVFQPLLVKFGKFLAILGTYIFSSILHGINVQVALVLISLALFSYSEMQFREFLANRLDACVRSRNCAAKCGHRWQKDSFITSMINNAFTIIAIVQLAYTGCVMQSDNEPTSIYKSLKAVHLKWYSLGYFCHYLAFIMFALSLTNT